MGEETEKQTNKVGVVATVSKRSRHRKKLLYQELKKQMEFYFSDVNLTKNRLMQELCQQSPSVDLSVFLKFNKIKAMTTRIKDIAKALQSSELLKVSECGTKVLRTTPPQQKLNGDECTIYVEQIPFDADHNWIQSIFQPYGPVDYISIPKFKHSQKNKGFAFVEFKDVQSAKNALTAFTEIGCCLSTQMDPGQLYSVKTFTENEETRPDDENKATGRKRKLSETKSNKDDAEEEREDDVSPKKVKTEDRSSPLNTPNHNEHENLPNPCQESSLSAEKNDSESAADDDNEDEGDVDGDDKRKKNRKRKKKHKRNKSGDHSYGLQILSKAEWKWLRNKYLNQQKEKMKELKQYIWHNKQHAQHQQPPIQHNSDTDKIEIGNRLTLTPGLIVRVQLDEPVISKASFKSEAKIYPEIKYIDVSEGSHTVFMRFSNASAAQQCVESNHWKTATVIKGEEEKLYWDKIVEERRVKLSKDNKQAGDHRQKSKKGREKLLKKAEQMHHNHIWFD